jgi:molecular chaperone DnaK (HSP70)
MGTLGIELEKGLYLGIDFGTTNSVVSIYYYDEDEIYTIPIEGSFIFPSVIQFEADYDEEDKLQGIFGLQAKEGAIIYPESTVMSIKRLLGTNETISIKVENKTYNFTPEQIAGQILGYIKEKADEYIREELSIMGEFNGCVITVPANSTDNQKKKTKEAAVMAGFNEACIYLRLEPAAAAIEYAIHMKESKRVLVYDFGGGTFDACILNIDYSEAKEPKISIMSTYGDNYLGGNDIDKIMMDILYDDFLKQTNYEIDLFDFNKDDGVSKKHKKMAIVRLYQVANQAKERLSSTLSTKVVLTPFIHEPKIININVEITRDDFYNHKRQYQMDDSDKNFEKMSGKSVSDLICQTTEIVDKTLEAAGLLATDIDEIFLVGGSSSIPEVYSQIEAKFKKEPIRAQVSPALSISRGAAYYCNMIMSDTMKSPMIQEKTIHSLGLEIAGRKYMEIVPRGVAIPKEGLVIESEEILETNYDQITSMAITIYEDTLGERESGLKYVYDQGMKRLAGTTLQGIKANVKGSEKVKVIFGISQDNILSVEAKSLSEDGSYTTLLVDNLY